MVLTISGITSAMSGYNYEAVFTNSHGSAPSARCVLTVQSTQPADLSADSPLTDGSLLLPADAAALNYVSGAATGQVLLSVDTLISPSDGSGSGHGADGRHRQRND